LEREGFFSWTAAHNHNYAVQVTEPNHASSSTRFFYSLSHWFHELSQTQCTTSCCSKSFIKLFFFIESCPYKQRMISSPPQAISLNSVPKKRKRKYRRSVTEKQQSAKEN
jgi:hypothetical protein